MLRLFCFLLMFNFANASVVSQISFRTYFFGKIGVNDYFKKDLYLGQMYGGLCIPDMSKQVFSSFTKFDNDNYISFNKSFFDKYVPPELYEKIDCFQFRLEDVSNKNCLRYGATLRFNANGSLRGFVRETFYNRYC